MKRNRKLSRSEALGLVNAAPVTPVENGKYESPRARFNREEAEEAERQAAIRMQPVRQAEQQLNTTMQELRAQHADDLLSGSSQAFLSYTTPITDDDVVENGKPIEISVVRERIRNAFDQVALKLEDEGIRFTKEGRQRLQSIAQIAQYRSVNWMLAKNWLALFQYADEVGLMTERECSRHAALQPVAAPVMTSLEELNTETREGRAKASRLLMESMQEEARLWFNAFADSISRNFSYALSDKEAKDVCDQMLLMNRSWTVARNWDLSRRELVRKGLLPERLRYPNEILDDLIETGDTRSFSGRKELQRQERLLMGNSQV